MPKYGSRLIQAAQEAAAMARGETVPGAVVHVPPDIPRQRRKVPLPPVPAFACDDPLLTAREAAAVRRQGLSTFWRDVRNGTVPQPVRITPKAPRWRLSWLTGAAGRAGSSG